MAGSLDASVVAACEDQAHAVGRWLDTLTVDDLAKPSTLPGWRIVELAMHLVHGISVVAAAIDAPRPPRGTKALTAAGYVSQFAAAAPEIAARERADADGLNLETIRARSASERAVLHHALAALAGRNPVVVSARGPIRVNDLLRTRVNELVTHSIDVARSMPNRPPPELVPTAVKIAVRFLAGILAENHPGRSVEVRVPPYAAVQIGDGPVHTRGTPPNVVETDPRTFVELATGRATFAVAFEAGMVRASGARSDLGAYLPVLS